MVHIAQHAIMRYQERVENLPEEKIIEILSRPIFEKAVKFGAPFVKLAHGQRAVIENGAIVTILPSVAKQRYLSSATTQKHRDRRNAENED